MVFAYSQIIKNTRTLSNNGLLDEEYLKEKDHKQSKSSKIFISSISIALTTVVVSLCAIGVFYKASGEQFTINNKTAMVIATNSMEGYINEDYKSSLVNNIKEYKKCSFEQASSFASSSQFNPGDVLGFTLVNKEEPLELYKIYGYKNSKGQIITHRLVDINGDNYIFRGDNAVGNDKIVKRNQIIYSYDNARIGYVGYLVLFSSSGFGIYSLIVVSSIFIMSDIAKRKCNKIKKDRLSYLEGENK